MPLPQKPGDDTTGLSGAEGGATTSPGALQMLGLQQEIAMMRRQLETVSEMQYAMQASLKDVRDAVVVGKAPRPPPNPTKKASIFSGESTYSPPPPGPRRASIHLRANRNSRDDALAIARRESGQTMPSDGDWDSKDSPSKPKRQITQMTVGPSENEEKAMLRALFEDAEAEEASRAELVAAKNNFCKYHITAFRKMSKEEAEMFMDSIMGLVIFCNAIFIGFSMDMNTKSTGWLAADITFSVIFLSELGIKLRMKGWFDHFCGHSKIANGFDVFLVVIDLLQLILMLSGVAEDSNGDLPSASLFRLIRLIKLARVLRLLRTEVFRDLLSMIQGMMGGMTTLGWSMMLFFLTVYMVSLVFREAFGRKQKENVYELFNSVPRSMFTTFRCSFGDCSTAGGVPIFEYVHEEYGALASIFYCCFVFTITIGLFNVISAIFVESTMVAAQACESAKKRSRLSDERRWNTRICTLIKRLMLWSPEHGSIPGKMSDAIEDIYAVDVGCSVIDLVVKDPEAIQALNDLDIDPEDHKYLADILDPDNGGSIRVCELIDGLRRLRGDPRRSDIVTVDLMIRSIQMQVGDIQAKVTSLLEAAPVPRK